MPLYAINEALIDGDVAARANINPICAGLAGADAANRTQLQRQVVAKTNRTIYRSKNRRASVGIKDVPYLNAVAVCRRFDDRPAIAERQICELITCPAGLKVDDVL